MDSSHIIPCIRHTGPRSGLAALGLALMVIPAPAEDEKVQSLPQVTYEATKLAQIGKGAARKGGRKDGWPECMAETKFRFIRLDHGGMGWDDGMGKSGADANFLMELAKATGFKTAAKGESHSITLLDKYPAKAFPPFVFLTGNGKMGRVSQKDIKILRQYCLKGGMLIADAGSPQFHQSFVHLMRQVFPDKNLVDVADDDMIYQLPYGFPNGAPAFWHHGGRRPLGIKHEGRWCVFYHPGDMNDAWKSAGYTDVNPAMREAAMQLGVNFVYYALCHWNQAVNGKPEEKKDKQDLFDQAPELDDPHDLPSTPSQP